MQDGERYHLAKRAAIETIENSDELEVAEAVAEVDSWRVKEERWQ